MVAFLKTSTTSHLPLKDSFNFTNMLEVLAQGQSGRIVILWDDNFINMTQISTMNQKIYVMLPNHDPWLFNVVYANIDLNNRIILWNNLKYIANS